MNINLSGSKKKVGKTLGFGLNKRSKKPKSNVFDDDDESSNGGDDEQDDPEKKTSKKDERAAVNREIAAEQEALRNRAKKAMAAASGDSLYDYDGAYDSFNPKKGAEKKAQNDEAAAPKKSRYIQDLMKQADKRNVERDAIYERKVAREQEEEDAQADFRGKEKFVTKAYKRKLEERRQLAAADKKQEEEDERQDVTKKTGGAAFANFYGNLNKNVAMGGTSDKPKDADEGRKGDIAPGSANDKLAAELGFMDGFERSGNTSDDKGVSQEAQETQRKEEVKEVEPVAIDPEAKRLAMRKAREEKIAQARIRYLERNGLSPEGVPASQ